MGRRKTMNIGITAVVYNGYGKFLNSFFRTLRELRTKPTKITIVLGKDHGMGAGVQWPPEINIVYADKEDNLGRLKNLAVLHTDTEWIMGMSIDDEILPWAIEEYERFTDADIIVSSYIYRGTKISKCMHPKINREVLFSKDYYLNGNNYMHGSTPFKRKLWVKNKYYENDCFNTLFWLDCASQNAKFAHTDIPCLVYNGWEGSHSSRITKVVRSQRFKIINDYRLKKINETINL